MNLAKQDLFVFVNEKEAAVGTVNTFCTSLSQKDEDGDYINAYLDVRFCNNLKEAYKLDKFVDGACLKVSVIEGWLSFRAWTDKQGNERRTFYVFVNDARIEEYIKEEEEKPKKKQNSKTTSKRR